MKQYYQIVSTVGRYGTEYMIYKARKNDMGAVSIAQKPITLIGNTPEEILDTVKQIGKDIKTYPPIPRHTCNIFSTADDATSEAFEIDDIYDIDTEHELLREFEYVERFGL